MKPPRSLYARPEIIRGEQCAGARPHAGRCEAAVSGGGGQSPQHRCRHRGAVLGGRAPPGAVTRVRSGRPAAVAGARMSGPRPGRSLPCPRPGPAVGRPSSPSSGRPTSGVQASGVQVSGVQVSGRTGLRCPRHCRRAVRVALDLERLGVEAAGWAQWVEVPPVSAGGWSPASGLPGSDGAAVGRARRPRGRPSPRGRRLPGVPAAAPPGRRADTGWSRARVPAGWGSPGPSRCSPVPRRTSGRSPAWRPTMGLDQEVVTTLGGRSARGGPVASSSGGPTRFGGEQPAAAARPRWVRSAASEVLIGP
jgi:hypothetical protein